MDKYTWVDIGSSYLPSDILAAFLFAQLEARESIQSRRREIWERYFNDLEHWAVDCGARLPVIPGHCDQSYHLFYVLMPSAESRQGLIRHLADRGIQAVFHYVPLHRSPMGQRLCGPVRAECPVTDSVSETLVRLPFYYDLTEQDQALVVEALKLYRAR